MTTRTNGLEKKRLNGVKDIILIMIKIKLLNGKVI